MSDSDECPRDDPDHVVEEPVTADTDSDQLLAVRKVHPADALNVLLNLQAVDSPDRRLGLRMRRAEAREVMLAHKILRSRFHRCRIERQVYEMAVPPEHRVGVVAVEDVVLVGLDTVRMTRVKVAGYFMAIADHDVSRKHSVKGIRDLVGRDPGVRVKHSHVPERMHTRIRPAGTCDHDLFSEQFRKCLVYHFFDRRAVRLHLPTDVIRAVICDGHVNPLHYCLLTVQNPSQQRIL